MNKNDMSKPHWSFWLITSIILIWNALGCVNFIVQMNPDIVSSYREAEQAIIRDRPLWVTMGFSLGVFAGTLGCILLLLKRSTSYYLFCASLFGIVIATAHSLTIGVSFGIGEIIGIVIMPVAIAVFLIWYAKLCQNKNWLIKNA